ncbi:MAG: discoidin domain-containing protein [Phycisphaerae bacterium]|nr:discoidin domain-containing protein [Phycisphaerae bacterium]
MYYPSNDNTPWTKPIRTMRAPLLATVLCLLWAASAVQAELPEGLGAYYRFNSTSGLTAIDETGAHNGTLTGALDWVAGVEGNALQFKGGNGSPFVNTGAWQTTGADGLGVALWAKWAGANSLYQGLVSHRDGTMYWWIEVSNNAAELRFKSNTSPQSNLFLTTPHLLKDEWMHVAFSHDAAAKRGVVYINGQEKLAGAWSLPAGNFATYRTGIGVVNCADGLGTFNGALDEVMIFQRPLTAAQVQDAMDGFDNPVATKPNPADGQSDVPTDVTLAWTSNGMAATHDVYLGTTAENLAPVALGLTETAFQPAEPLEYGTTYFWRVDEVNGAPDNTVSAGEVWRFTTEPFSYPIAGVIATASSSAANMGPEKTVDGSGLTGDLHSNDNTHMWLTSPTGSQPAWIQFQFDKVYKLDEMWVWNSNQGVETFVGFGVKDVAVEYSTDGATWTTLADVPEFAQATGQNNYAHNTTVEFGGVEAQYVKLTINSNWGMLKQYGLSEVRFLYIPVQARLPQPPTAATGVRLDTDLSWRPGREATSHEVHFGLAVDALAPAGVVADHRYTPDSLTFGTTYYWKVDEVGDTGTYPGEVWSFTTQEYAVIDDFESYTDEEGSRIYETWIDGLTTQKTASMVGYMNAPFAERTILHGGAQSMPFEYNNVKTPHYSEAERSWDTPQNWTVNGADTLSLYFRGYPTAFLENADGSITMGAGGADIWGNADQFRFAYKRLSGDGSIVTRVDKMIAADGWTKVGVMIRENLEAGSRHAMVAVTPSNGVSFLNRATPDGASTQVNQTGLTAPYWVKLTRTGNNFTAQRSADGVTWTNITADAAASTVTIGMAADVYIGLAVTSHNTAMQTSAQFSQVSTTGGVSGSWQNVAIGVAQPGNAPGTLYITLEDRNGRKKTVNHSDIQAVTVPQWQQWKIPLSEFSSAGVNIAAIENMVLGVDNRANPASGGAGLLFIDDIAFGKPSASQ